MVGKCFKYKKKSAFILLLVLLCVYLPAHASKEAVGDQKNILIINSYHQGYTWSREQTDGLIDVLKDSGGNLSIFIEYMDWKNYPTKDNLQHLYNYYEYKYCNKRTDLLIVTDDIVLEFALDNRESLFANAPIVFCGVNQNGVEDITGGYKNFTGVLEEVDPTKTIEMAYEINPYLKNVYVLFDNSESGVSSRGETGMSFSAAM